MQGMFDEAAKTMKAIAFVVVLIVAAVAFTIGAWVF